jgi:death on curing protein
VRDIGLLEAAVHRPRASVLGQDAYPDLFTKAAALLHSLARNHPLVDGNKRLAWLATYVFCAKNGVELDPDDDAAYDLVIAVAFGSLDEIDEIARILGSFVSTVD